MKQSIQKSVSLLLVFLLVFSSMPLQAIAEQSKQPSEAGEAEIGDPHEEAGEEETDEEDEETPLLYENIEPDFLAGEHSVYEDSEWEEEDDPAPLEEVTEERTENTKLFINDDGTYTQEVYFEPIHTLDEQSGEWQDISSDLEQGSSGEIATENTDLTSNFKSTMEDGEYASYTRHGHTLTFSLLTAEDENGEQIVARDQQAVFGENEITYSNVFPDIDLRHFTFNQSTKEDLVLQTYNGVHIFNYKIETELDAQENEDGSITFSDENGEAAFELPKPFMADSNYDDAKGETAESDAVSYKLEAIDGGYELTIDADKDWLADEERVYPVYIDPTTSVNVSADAFVMSAYPTTNYSSASSKWDSSQNAHVLKVGKYDSTTGTTYGFLKQSIDPVKHMTVTKATLNVHVIHHYYGDNPNGLWLDTVNSDWQPGSLNWNNKPGSTNIGKVDVGRNKPASFDVTSTVKAWLDGSKKNFGFKLHTNGNGKEYWKKVISTTNTSKKPYLSITYTIPAPAAPTSKTYTNGDGTGHVNLSWKKMPGATGYKVWVYNGKDYQGFDVGNVTSWSTEGKKLWPTASDIAAGKFKLYTNGKGAELAVDPSPVYKNSGGNFPNSKNYWFRVSAVYGQGESAMSAEHKPTIPNLKKPDRPTAKSYSNGNGTGYIDLNWPAVSGASGYKLYMYNGKNYESIDVGNVTSYTTKGKKVWPTAAEIKAGKFNLHLSDNAGAELPIDPSPVYKNSGGNYPNAKDFNFKIQAYNKHGETVRSASALPYIPDLAKPKAPNGVAYTNMKSENTGYIMLDWEEIENASGYKVWISNGKTYTSFDVGDTTHWTTQGKGIWPTAADIAAGKSALYTNGKGNELAVDPSPVYKNAGGNASAKTYFIRLTAYNKDGETIQSPDFKPSISQPTELFGEEDYWSILTVPYGKVNAATGNLIVSEDDLSIDGRGPGLGFTRTYNSLAPTSGMFGYGWHADSEMTLKQSGNQALFVDDDGTLHVFTKQGDGTYKPPTGVYLELEETSDALILTTKEQTKAHFSKTTGKLVKLVDGHNNETTYTYEENRLKAIEDASGRQVSFDYNADGTVKTAHAPGSRKLVYRYDKGRLVSYSDFDGAVTTYEYDESGKLTAVYEPTHTDEKPVVNRFLYNGDMLKEAINPRNEAYTLSYDLQKRQLLFTQPNNRKLSYTYNAAGNPIRYVEDVDGLKLTTEFKYEGNNLTETTDPNDVGSGKPTESFQYDKDGNIVKAVDDYGTETYTYNDNHDVISMVDTEGDEVTIAYDGLDPVSETDQSGKTASASKYAKNGNLTEESYELATAANVLANGQFENGTTSWTRIDKGANGAFGTDKQSPGKLAGPHSLKMTLQSQSTGTVYQAATQVVEALPNVSYTFSSLIKTDTSGARAFLNVEILDSTGKRIKWVDNRYSHLSGKQEWVERQLTFTTPANTAKIRVYLELESTKPDGTGTAWFDQAQLERAEVSSSFNPIANSSFLNGATGWSGSGGTIDNDGFDDGKSLKITKTASQGASEYKQTVTLNQAASEAPIDVTLTGLSKADNVKSSNYGLKAKVYYTDGSTADFGPATFPEGTQDWNRANLKITKSKPITKIDVSFFFQGSGTAWFDDIRLLEGSVVKKQTYDDKGNYVTKVEDELGYVTTSVYDDYGNEIESTDALGKKKYYTYDLANQLKQLKLDNGTTISYTYDKNGNMLSKSIAPPSGQAQTFTYEYDAAGKLMKTVGPLGDVVSNQYDANSNLTKTTTANGHTTEMTYDGTDRMATKSYNGELAYRFTYDKNGNELTVKDVKAGQTKTRTFDKKDRMVTLTDRGGKQEWTYSDTSDKLNQFTLTHGSFTQTNTYEYNKKDENIRMKDGDATYHFDYDEKGNIKTYTSGNGTGASFTYDPRGLVTTLSVGTTNGPALLEEFMAYDANGNRTEIKDRTGKAITYTYGPLDQLTSETLRDGTKTEFAYDGFGNRISVKTTKNGQTTETKATYNVYNQLTSYGSETLTYDESGNRLTDGAYTYTWDAADQITAITKTGENKPFVTYRYDEDGRRIEKTVGTTVTNYHYDGDSLNVLYETNGTGAVTKSYTYSESGQLVAMKKGNAKYYYHYNAHGDVIALTDKDGKRLATYEYDAWGNPLNVEEADEVKDNPYRYAGYQYDHETGMYYLMARYYEPKHGVFLSLDPDPGDDDDILTQNGYSYANNNPVMLVDPDGHWVWAAVGGVIGGISSYKAAKAKGAKGWKLFGATAGGAALGAIGGGKIKAIGKFIGKSKLGQKVPYRITSQYKRSGSLIRVVKRSGKNKGRKFGLDYHKFRENKRESTRKILHVHFGKGKKIQKHRVIYPRRSKIKWK
ncbi:DNRLRE domain-containing protein [Bacillus sp. FSL K6-6483]|nr:DNRLRE domain-containing protein [Psychrobacillus sp. MER TA 17]